MYVYKALCSPCCVAYRITSSGARGTARHPGADKAPLVGPCAVQDRFSEDPPFKTGCDFYKVEAGWTAHKIAFLVPSSQRNFSIHFWVLPALVAALFSLPVLLANTVTKLSVKRGQEPISIPFSIFIALLDQTFSRTSRHPLNTLLIVSVNFLISTEYL